MVIWAADDVLISLCMDNSSSLLCVLASNCLYLIGILQVNLKKMEQIHFNNIFTYIYSQHKYSYVYLCRKYLLLVFGLFTFER